MSTKSVLERLDKTGAALETFALVAILTTMMIVAVGQIVMREVFGTGFGWADEFVRLMVLWLALVGSVAACRDNRHIRIDALSHVLPDIVVQVVRVLVDLFAAVVCAILAVSAWRYLQVEIEYEVKVLVNTPAWIAHMIMPAAFALIGYRFLISGIKQSRHLFFGDASAAAE
ncbi:MAG: TRAP transporter small permease [Proteobacteria bacterium]|nr:TRAP transporter small permease [Pseudomonadota bacterium]